MANTKSAEKRIRQERKRRQHNRAQRSQLRTAIKSVLGANDEESARAALKETEALLDRFATRNLVHRNKARRKKSQLARHVATLSEKA